jgi:riboflavin kinase / FMN adenylyltransferase
MLVLKGSAGAPAIARGAVYAIGNFDGVHRGHQSLIDAAAATALERGAKAGVIMFEPHPREFFVPHEPHFHLTPLDTKLGLLEAHGIDIAVVLAFDAALAGLAAEEFIERVLVADLAVSGVVIGYDFFFGRSRKGNPRTMHEAGVRHGFTVSVIDPVAEGGEVFSSSAVRLALAGGDVKGAAAILGRAWRVSGKVVGGAHRGTGLGFPTANVPMPKGTALGHGIYAVRALIEGEAGAHDAAAYLGTRPTFDSGMPVLEVFLFDFDGDLYGRAIEVEFVDFIRHDRKFDTIEALITQMADDCAKARAALRA